MFQIDRSNWGNWEVLRLSDSSGNSIVIAPARGACLLDLSFNGRHLLRSYQNEAELSSLDWMRSALLFPFPNRMKDGQYQWHGQQYQFPINEPARNNALHGFGGSAFFKTRYIQLGETEACVCLVYRHTPTDSYPFPFLASVTYRIQTIGQFDLEFKVENLHSTSIPFAWGWHPYFQLQPDADLCSLQLPACKLVEVTDQMLPNGKRSDFNQFEKPASLKGQELDHCFAFSESARAVTLFSEKSRLEIYPLAGQAVFPFFQVFIPPDRQSVALEPMTANIDAFHNRQGLWEIKPGESKYTGATVACYPV
ncbi:MAG: hypothetical protein KDC34_05975 [Saprospiraceae bacterium]|nr:hypothetical protein [Saprospiraceae bacterium]